MIVLKCAKCKSKIFKYIKVGKGKILYCWQERIIENYSIRDGNEVRCQCGNLVGIDEGKGIKMKQHSFNYSGTRTKG